MPDIRHFVAYGGVYEMCVATSADALIMMGAL